MRAMAKKPLDEATKKRCPKPNRLVSLDMNGTILLRSNTANTQTLVSGRQLTPNASRNVAISTTFQKVHDYHLYPIRCVSGITSRSIILIGKMQSITSWSSLCLTTDRGPFCWSRSEHRLTLLTSGIPYLTEPSVKLRFDQVDIPYSPKISHIYTKVSDWSDLGVGVFPTETI